MERRFLIQEIEFDQTDPRLITEAELRKRLSEIYWDCPPTKAGEDKAIAILLHGEGEKWEVDP